MSNKNEKLKAAVIGLGNRGQSWLRRVLTHPDYELTALADMNGELLSQVAGEYEIPMEKCHTELAAALATSDVAIVVVPHHHHYSVAKEGLTAGVHCLVEKPFTMNMAEARELVELADERKRVLQVGQNYRFRPVCQYLAKAIGEEWLGKLTGVEASFHRYRPPRGPHEQPMPWPLIFTQSIHHFDWLMAILPAPISEVRSVHRRPPWSQWDHPSVCRVVMKCEDEVIISYNGSYESQGETSTYTGRWRFECEKGDLVIDAGVEGVNRVTERGAKLEQLFEPDKNAPAGEHVLLDQMRDAIRKGVEPETSGRRNLATLELLFKVIGEA